MSSDKIQSNLEVIFNHHGVTYRKLSKYKYILRYSGRCWYLWPRSGRYQQVFKDGTVSEIFMGEIKQFYHRYITEVLKLPENHGKTWSEEDENILYDMIEHFCTVRQISEELERHPASVVSKLAKYLDNNDLLFSLDDNKFDVPVRALVEWN
jgi:hypothetical protein